MGMYSEVTKQISQWDYVQLTDGQKQRMTERNRVWIEMKNDGEKLLRLQMI